jgi:hypothetical protein
MKYLIYLIFFMGWVLVKMAGDAGPFTSFSRGVVITTGVCREKRAEASQCTSTKKSRTKLV